MIRLALENLAKAFDGVAAVDRASLEVRPGGVAYLLGPSGAGKSTLLRLVAGLDRPDDGEIYFDGRLVGGLPPRDRNVGFVAQADSLWPHLSALDNVAYPLAVRKAGRRDRRARALELLAAARLESVAAKRPADLSPPQRRRVALARALARRPGLLLLDDPAGPLADRDRAEFRDDLRRLAAESAVTTLVATADPAEALASAEHLAVMDLGKVLQSGDPSTVYNRPVDPFVARYLGPTNLIPGQVESTDARGDVVVRSPLGRIVGRAAAPLAPGSTATLAVRPEALGFGSAIPHLANRFAATIERLVFRGPTREVHLRGANDWPLVALALQPQSLPLREGQPLTVHVAADQVIVLPTKHVAPPSVVLPNSG